MTARNGIGSSAAPIQTNVTALAGQTVTGDLFVNNSGDVTVGFAGEPANVLGLQSTGASGNVSLSAGGNVFVTRNKDVIKGPTSVAVTTTGASHNIVTGGGNVGAGAAVFSNGAVNLNAGGTIFLGDAGAGLAGDVQGGGPITLMAGQDVVLDEGTVLNSQGGGNVAATAAGNITLQKTGNVTGASITTHGGAIALTTGMGGTFTLDSGTGGRLITTLGGVPGPITATADFMTINDPINAGTGIVLLRPVTAAQPINLGTINPSQLGLTDAELKQVTASVLRIGNSTNTGGIVLSGAINQMGGGYGALSLVTGGSITEAVNGQLTVNRLALQAGSGIGSAALPLTTGASSIAFTNTGGVVNISNLQALTITGVDTVTTATNTGTTTNVVSSGPLTVALSVTSTGSVTLQAQKPTSNPPPTTDLTVNSGFTVKSTGAGTGVTLEAADNIFVPAGAVVGDAGTSSVTMTAGFTNPGSTGGISLLGSALASSTATLSAPGDITLSTVTVGTTVAPSGTLTVTSTAGNIRDDGILATALAAQTYNFTAAKAIGGDAQISRDGVLLQDAAFKGALDLLPSTDANGNGTATINITQTGAGGNVQLRDTNGRFDTRMLGTVTLKSAGGQFALIASGVLVPGTTFNGDLLVDNPLTLPATANDNLLLAATNGNSVRVGNFSPVVNNGATGGITLVTSAGQVLTSSNLTAKGPVNLTAAGNASGNGVTVAFNVTTGGGITIDSNRDVVLSGALTTTGLAGGPITVISAEDLNGSATAGNGFVAMRAGSSLDTSSSNSAITVQGGGAAKQGGDVTLETVNAGTGPVTVTAFVGNLLNNGDGALNVSGGAITLSANGFTGINLSVNTTTPATAGVTANDPNGSITLSDPSGHLQVNSITAGANAVSLTAGGFATTGVITSLHPNDNVADVTATTVTLTALGPSDGATGQIGFFSGVVAQFFEVFSKTLSASTSNSRLWIASIGGTALGSVNAGSEVAVLKTVNGDFTSTHTGSTPDVTAGTAVLQATVLPTAPPGTTASLGSAANPLLLAAGTLNGTVSSGAGSLNVNGVAGDLKVSQALTASGPVNIGDVGHALTIINPAVAGNAVIGSAGANVTISADTVTTTNTSGNPDVQAATFAVKAKFDVGSAAAPLQTLVNVFTAQGRNIFLNNTGALTLGPVAGAPPFAVTGAITINSTSSLTVAEPVQAVGDINLTTTTGANANLVVGPGQSVSSGGAVNLSAGDGLVLQSNSAIVSRTKGPIGMLLGTKGKGSNSVIAGGLFGGSATAVGGAGTNILTIDFTGGANLSSNLSFNGGGTGILSYSDLNGGGAGHFYVLNKTNIERDGANFVFPSNLKSLFVFGSQANNLFLVQGTPTGVTTSLNGEGPVNGFFISSDAPTSLGNLSGIGGPVFVAPGSGPGNLLVVSEASRPTPDDVTLTANTITQSAGNGFQINYPSTGFIGGNLKLVVGGGNDVVRVQGTPAGAATSVYTLGGNGTVVVSSPRGTLDTIQGILNIDAGTGAAQLIISEANAVIGDSLVLSPNQLYSATYGFVINYTASGGSFSRGFIVQTGQNNDVVTVNGTTAGAYTLVNTGPGANQVRVNVSGPSSDPLIVDGGSMGVPAGNVLFVTDVAGGATISNFPSGPESGVVRVSYPGRGSRDIYYFSFDQVFTNPAAS